MGRKSYFTIIIPGAKSHRLVRQQRRSNRPQQTPQNHPQLCPAVSEFHPPGKEEAKEKEHCEAIQIQTEAVAEMSEQQDELNEKNQTEEPGCDTKIPTEKKTNGKTP